MVVVVDDDDDDDDNEDDGVDWVDVSLVFDLTWFEGGSCCG